MGTHIRLNLKVGDHKVTAVFETGTAERKFNVSDKPKTGDESMALWTGLLILSSVGAGAIFLTLRRKTSAR